MRRVSTEQHLLSLLIISVYSWINACRRLHPTAFSFDDDSSESGDEGQCSPRGSRRDYASTPALTEGREGSVAVCVRACDSMELRRLDFQPYHWYHSSALFCVPSPCTLTITHVPVLILSANSTLHFVRTPHPFKDGTDKLNGAL